MKSINILQCPTTYLPTYIGGIEIYVSSLSRELENLGHEVKILVPQYPDTSKYPSEYDGISILTYNESMNTTKKEFQGKIKGKGFDDFINIVKNENPDIVHFHQLTSSNGVSIFHIEAVKELGIKVVYTNHLAGLTCSTGKLMYKGKVPCNGMIDNIKCAVCQLNELSVLPVFGKAIVRTGIAISYLFPSLPDRKSRLATLFSFPRLIEDKRISLKKLIQLADAFIVISSWYLEVLKINGLINGKIQIIKQALPSSSNISLKPTKRVITMIKLIYVGRINSDKGLDIILSAMQGIDCSDLSLDVFGKVDDMEYLEKCKKLSANSNVSWHGYINSSEVISTISEYDAMVLPSMIAEMAPLVIQEAFAAGKPVIGSNIGGISEEIVHGKNGYLFEMGNIKELKSLLKSIIANKNIILNIQYQKCEIRTFRQVALETQTVYEEILS